MKMRCLICAVLGAMVGCSLGLGGEDLWTVVDRHEQRVELYGLLNRYTAPVPEDVYMADGFEEHRVAQARRIVEMAEGLVLTDDDAWTVESCRKLVELGGD